jgi:hypothetical protein
MVIIQNVANLLGFVFVGKALRLFVKLLLRSKNKGCPAMFVVRQKNGHLVVMPKSVCMTHNHLCVPLHYALDPVVRRLDDEQLRMVKKMINYGTPSNRIRVMAIVDYGKYMLPSDVTNIRYRCTETGVPASKWLLCFKVCF